MYIPLSTREAPSAALRGRDEGGLLRDGRLHRLLTRQFSDNPVENVNIRTGVIVGIVLGVFLIGLIFFFYWYRRTIRFSYRKRRRHGRKPGSRSSKSSKSSKSSDGGGAPEPPPEEAPQDG